MDLVFMTSYIYGPAEIHGNSEPLERKDDIWRMERRGQDAIRVAPFPELREYPRAYLTASRPPPPAYPKNCVRWGIISKRRRLDLGLL